MDKDKHLWKVIGAASEEDLKPLAELVSDKDMTWSWNRGCSLEQLRSDLHDNILLNGGNSIVNFFRGGGVSWAEIVRDVADKLDVPYAKGDATPDIEQRIAMTVLEKAIDQMTPEQLEELRNNLERAGLPRNIPIGQGAMVGALIAGRVAGFAAYKVLVIVANAVARALIGRGLSFAAGATLTRLLGIALGPVGWIITGVWTAIDIASPAYRITIPSVVMVGVLRASQAS